MSEIQVLMITTAEGRNLLFRTDTRELCLLDTSVCVKVDQFELIPPRKKELTIDWSAFDLMFETRPDYGDLANALSPGIKDVVQCRANDETKPTKETIRVDTGLPRIKVKIANDTHEMDVLKVVAVNFNLTSS